MKKRIVVKGFLLGFLLLSSVWANAAEVTKAGVIERTNAERLKHGSSALRENARLTAVAQKKAHDMFKQQYFQHVNPQGVGPGRLDKEAGYSYMAMGENLAAMMTYASYEVLFDMWMNSSGHRSNILNSRFQDIGVAVEQGIYKGRKTWFVVQEFGKVKQG